MLPAFHQLPPIMGMINKSLMTDKINIFGWTMNPSMAFPSDSTQLPPQHGLLKNIWNSSFEVAFKQSVGWIWWFLGCQMSFLSWSVSIWGSARSYEVTIQVKRRIEVWYEHLYLPEIIRWWMTWSSFMLFKIVAKMNKAIDGPESISQELMYSGGTLPGMNPVHWSSLLLCDY